MKSILLTTTALVAFAGAAVAEGHTGISFSGEATLGYNNRDTGGGSLDNDNEYGFYWDSELDVSMASELDNGITATATFGLNVADDSLGDAVESSDFVISLETEGAGLFVGDTAFAAETRWVAAGDMEADGFSEADGEGVIRGDVDMMGIGASVSLALADAGGDLVSDDTVNYDDDEFDQISLGATYEFSNFTVGVAYQEESIAFGDDDGELADADGAYTPSTDNGDFNTSEIVGVFGSTSFSGADITLAYAENLSSDESSLGGQVAYPFGPVTATVYYVAEDDSDNDEDNYGATLDYANGPVAVTADYDYDQGDDIFGVEGSYDVGNGISVLAGAIYESDEDETDYYIASTYDLGGGAELLVSYAEDENNDEEDAVGDPEYQEGFTVEVSFSF